MLAPLRTANYPAIQLPNYVDAMKTVVFNHFSTETVRNLATFLVSTLKQTMPNRSTSISSQRPNLDFDNTKESPTIDIVADPRETILPGTLKHAVMGNAIMDMLEQILCEKNNVEYVHKFATTVTNKWTLLFIENPGNPFGAVLAMRILARLLYTQGAAYLSKFKASYGFLVLQSYIPQFWNVVPMIHVVLCILLGVDVCDVPLRTPLDSETLHTLYGESFESVSRVPCFDILPTLMAMLKNGVAATVAPAGTKPGVDQERTARVAETYQTLVGFLTDMQSSSRVFKEIFTRQEFIDDLASILFPFICNSSKAMVVENELDCIASEPSVSTGDSTVHMGGSVDAEPTSAKPASGRSSQHSSVSTYIASEAKTADTDSAHESEATIVTGTRSESPPLPTTSASAASASLQASQTVSEGSLKRTPSTSSTGRVRDVDLKIVQEPIALSLLKLFVVISIDSILDPAQRPLAVIDLIMQSCPPAYKEHQIYFQSFLLGHIVIGLEQNIEAQPEVLTDSRVMANVDQYCELVVDLTCQGWFVGSYLIQFDLIANVLEILSQETSPATVPSGPPAPTSRPDAARTHLTSLLYRLVCFTLGQCQVGNELQTSKLDTLLDKCIYYQKILLSHSPGDVEFMKCLILHLFSFLSDTESKTRANMLILIKLVFLMRPIEASGLLKLRPTHPSDDEDSADEGYSALVEGVRSSVRIIA
ncbi:hypothetical protein BGX20_005375, partial [Mortierella sp. AD010]